MGRHAGAFKSEKRKKELARQKKQEEKRKKRIQKDPVTGLDVETTEPEAGEETPGQGESTESQSV